MYDHEYAYKGSGAVTCMFACSYIAYQQSSIRDMWIPCRNEYSDANCSICNHGTVLTYGRTVSTHTREINMTHISIPTHVHTSLVMAETFKCSPDPRLLKLPGRLLLLLVVAAAVAVVDDAMFSPVCTDVSMSMQEGHKNRTAEKQGGQ